MPRRDGSGPFGEGSLTGRGFGFCAGAVAEGYKAARGWGAGMRGFRGCGPGWSYGGEEPSSKLQKEMLTKQKSILQSRLKAIDEQIESL